MRKVDVIRYFGTTVRVSDAVEAAGYNLNRTAVSQWSDIVPELSARRIAAITGGAVPLREEDYRRAETA